MRAFDKSPRVIGIAPQQNARCAAVPKLPAHLVFFRIDQKITVSVPTVALVSGIDVHGMKWQTQLLHPILRADMKIDTHIQCVLDFSGGEAFRAEIDRHFGCRFLDGLKCRLPERSLFAWLESRFVMHPELDSINRGESF